MSRVFRQADWRYRIAVLAFALGFIGLFAGSPYRGTRAVVDTRELAMEVQREVDHVSVTELADWLIQGKSDFRLLDLRSEKEFADYHIPSAEQVSLSVLPDFGIHANEKIVLYSEGGIHSAQAWYLLRATGFKHVYILRGGLEEWQDQILFPRLSDTATPEQKSEFGKLAAISSHFGGNPQMGGVEPTLTTRRPMPKMDASLPASGSPAGGTGKKEKEGC